MEGIVFYWTCWTIWVFLTFVLDKKNKFRFKLSFIILLAIIFSNSTFSLGQYEINRSSFLLLITSYLFISQEKKRWMILYYFICSFIITMAYVAFHLFELYDPIWVVFNKNWMIAVCIGYLAILLQKNLKSRLLIVLCGTIQGEMMYAYILSKYQFSYLIGSFEYLDVCSLIAALLLGWSFFENAGAIFQQFFHISSRGKQKTS